jgi:mRNA interferase MazF
MVKKYIPARGDIVWLTFDPQAGHEQAGRRPALVLSPASYNQASGLSLVCPVTNQNKGYPFDVLLPADGKVGGVIQTDQIKSVDWQERQAKMIVKAPDDIVCEVQSKLAPLLGC